MNPHPTDNSKVAEEAAYWLHRLEHNNTAETQTAFMSWIRKASVHLEEFLFAQATWKALDGISADVRARYENGAHERTIVGFMPPPGDADVHSDRGAHGKRTARLDAKWRFGVAAALALIATGWIAVDLLKTPNIYITAVGEQRFVKMADGSVMQLNARSRAQVIYTDSVREVRLEKGEALFSVEKDAARPFVVVTDNAWVRALGTQFNVYRRTPGDTRVAVVEGAVQVRVAAEEHLNPAVEIRAPSSSPMGSAEPPAPSAAAAQELRLAAGDEAQVTSGVVKKKSAPDVQRAVAWRKRELIFSGQSVREIVEEFNRYNDRPIRVEGKALQERRLSGVFAADNPMPFIRFLSRETGIEVANDGEEIVIRARD